MRAYGTVGTLLGVAVAVWALGCKSDLPTGQGGTGGKGGTAAGGTTSTTGGTAGTSTATGGFSGSGGVAGTGGVAGAAGHPVTAIPPLHRPTASVCSDAGAPLSGYDGGARGPIGDAALIRCTTDSACPACSNGLPDRCVDLHALAGGGGGGAPGSACACDECTSDQDCGSNGVCACGALGGNVCLPGNCRIDADCGPGGYCSPSLPRSCGGGDRGYYCHTAQDQCRADADCQGTVVPSSCAYSIEAAIWTCAAIVCAG